MSPVDMSRYPSDWKTIRARILARANHRCEQCGAVNYEPHPETGSKVVLTIAHLDNPDPMDCRDENLKAMCQACHLRYDAKLHAMHAKETRARKRREKALNAGQLEMWMETGNE